MADGSEKQIKHVRMGDRVKTIVIENQSKAYKLVEDEVLVRLHHEPSMTGTSNLHVSERNDTTVRYFFYFPMHELIRLRNHFVFY